MLTVQSRQQLVLLQIFLFIWICILSLTKWAVYKLHSQQWVESRWQMQYSFSKLCRLLQTYIRVILYQCYNTDITSKLLNCFSKSGEIIEDLKPFHIRHLPAASQLTPSPSYPIAQAQLKDPATLVHIAFSWQLFEALSEHSSISDNRNHINKHWSYVEYKESIAYKWALILLKHCI